MARPTHHASLHSPTMLRRAAASAIGAGRSVAHTRRPVSSAVLNGSTSASCVADHEASARRTVLLFPPDIAAAALGSSNYAQRRWKHSSYEFPMRDEAPVITRHSTTAAAAEAFDSDDGAIDDAKEKKASRDGPPPNEPDRFDDNGTLSEAERSQILQAQKQHIRTELDAAHRIAEDPPSFIPPSLPFSSMAVPETIVSTLPNGIRVASQETYGQVCTVGVLSNCGSRHETSQNVGVNHLLELLAFQSTENRDAQDISALMDEIGGATFASGSREQMMYCVDVLRPNVEVAMEVMADTILRPRIEEADVEGMKRVIEFQHLDMLPEVKLGEGLQVAGYGPIDGEIQQLGRPHFCPLEALPALNTEVVHNFRKDHLLLPHEMVIAGAGIGHDELVKLAERFFSDIPVENPNQAPFGHKTIDSKYTGGGFQLQTETVDGFTRVALAFEVGGWHSDDLVPTCVLQTLLGGGNSFSAGGPGKGMYSRLYREVLNRYHWAESAEAFTSFHAESGLLGISGSSAPLKSLDVTRVLAEHFGKLATQPVTDEELDRARNMLKCNVLTQLESRLVLFEDIGRQILTYGKREDSHTMSEKIDSVTKEDIMVIARKAISSPPTLATVGDDISKVPPYEEVAAAFQR